MIDMPHQIATKALGAGATNWLSRHRFPDLAQAEAGALALSDFLGAEYRA
jgi:hypothetical protein